MAQPPLTSHSSGSGRIYPFQPYMGRSCNVDEVQLARQRYLYDLDPLQQCLSPHLANHDVLAPLDMLYALETVALSQNRPACPVDSSLMAFLVSRWKGLKYSDIRDMRHPAPQVKNLAQLRILADIQEFHAATPLPKLCRWMADLCAHQFSTLHHCGTRNAFGNEISQAIDEGYLNKLASLFNRTGLLTEDKEGYQAARTQDLLICSELKELERKIHGYGLCRQGLKEGHTISGTRNDGSQVFKKLFSLFRFLGQLPVRVGTNLRAVALRRKRENLRTAWGKLH